MRTFAFICAVAALSANTMAIQLDTFAEPIKTVPANQTQAKQMLTDNEGKQFKKQAKANQQASPIVRKKNNPAENTSTGPTTQAEAKQMLTDNEGKKFKKQAKANQSSTPIVHQQAAATPAKANNGSKVVTGPTNKLQAMMRLAEKEDLDFNLNAYTELDAEPVNSGVSTGPKNKTQAQQMLTANEGKQFKNQAQANQSATPVVNKPKKQSAKVVTGPKNMTQAMARLAKKEGATFNLSELDAEPVNSGVSTGPKSQSEAKGMLTANSGLQFNNQAKANQSAGTKPKVVAMPIKKQKKVTTGPKNMTQAMARLAKKEGASFNLAETESEDFKTGMALANAGISSGKPARAQVDPLEPTIVKKYDMSQDSTNSKGVATGPVSKSQAIARLAKKEGATFK